MEQTSLPICEPQVAGVRELRGVLFDPRRPSVTAGLVVLEVTPADDPDDPVVAHSPGGPLTAPAGGTNNDSAAGSSAGGFFSPPCRPPVSAHRGTTPPH